MSNILKMIGFGGAQNNQPTRELPDIFPFPVPKATFIKNDVETIYKRILIDTLERTYGIPEDLNILLWDSCLKSEKSEGLVTMVAKAMVEKSDLYLVYLPAVKLIRKANQKESSEIKADYDKMGESKTGIYISFSNYTNTDMMLLYSALEYCTIGSFHKKMNLSNAVQIKINDLRASIGTSDSGQAVEQAVAIATALGAGRDVLLDAKDILEALTPELESTNSASSLIDRKRSFYLGLPAAYIVGLTGKSLSDTGEADTKAVERGLKAYYFSIVKPITESLFKISTNYKSENNLKLELALQVLKDFELTSEQYISLENKQKVINKSFDLPEDAKGDGTPAASDEQEV